MALLSKLFSRKSKSEEEIKQVDRREYYRQKVNARCRLARLDSDLNTEYHLEGKLIDISAAGVKIYAPEEWCVGDLIELTWTYLHATNKTFKFMCRIVRTEPAESGSYYGCELLHLTEAERKELLQVIFELQQKERYTKCSTGT